MTFTFVFAFEMVAKMYGRGVPFYFKRIWNILDFVLVLTSLLGLLAIWFPDLQMLTTLRILRTLRPLRSRGSRTGEPPPSTPPSLASETVEATDSASDSTDGAGEKRQMPTFVYVIVFGELLIFWSFGLVQLVVSLRPPSKYYQGEVAYMWLSLGAKGLLGLLVLSNVLMLGSFTEIYED